MITIDYYKTNKGLLFKPKGYFIAPNYLINDKVVDTNFNHGWYIIDDEVITSFKNIVPNCSEFSHYELIDTSLSSNVLPLILTKEDVIPVEEYLCDGEYIDSWTNYSSIKPLYKEVSIEVPTKYEDVEFELNFLGEVEGDLNKPCTEKFKLYGGGIDTKVTEQEIKDIVHYSELDKILTPDFYLHNKPCFVPPHILYRIIRTYVKENINLLVAKITSDYDFCFTVKKVVKVKPYKHKTEVCKSGLKSYKPPKFKEYMVDQRDIEIFEMTATNYSNYTQLQPLRGENLEDLVNNLKQYLVDLITVINEPLKDCECCNGTGVVGNFNIPTLE